MKKIVINIPEEYQIDRENSNIENGIINFKKIKESVISKKMLKLIIPDSYYYTNSVE